MEPLPTAPPSPRIEKTREQWRKLCEERDLLITPEAILKCLEQIRAGITKYQGDRCDVPKQGMDLFDGNQSFENPVTKQVINYAKQLGGGFSPNP